MSEPNLDDTNGIKIESDDGGSNLSSKGQIEPPKDDRKKKEKVKNG